MAASVLVPDLIEPIVGWRSWRAVAVGGDEVRLASVVHEAVWPPREELVASCEARHWRRAAPWRQQDQHVAPAARCSCGIYAAERLEHVLRYLDDYGWRSRRTLLGVVGLVSLWGTVVECARGWRAERAYPQRLYVISPPKQQPRRPASEVAAALAAYRVPVALLSGATGSLAAQLHAQSELLALSRR